MNNNHEQQQLAASEPPPTPVATTTTTTTTTTTKNIKIRIAICGVGEIATKAHIPAILDQYSSFELVALVDPNFKCKNECSSSRTTTITTTTTDTSTGETTNSSRQAEVLEELKEVIPKDVTYFDNLSDCLDRMRGHTLDAVAVCTPSGVTLDVAQQALSAGKHVLVEKPPGDWRRLQELLLLVKATTTTTPKQTFFTAYHTTACVGLPHARHWLQQQQYDDNTNNTSTTMLSHVHVIWNENVRKWHPGQVWVTQKSNSNSCDGVLDMVFNPISLLVAALLWEGRRPGVYLKYKSSHLVVPSNWETPIAGSFELLVVSDDETTTTTTSNRREVPITGDFAWDYEPDNRTKEEQEEIWSITFVAQKNQSQSTTAAAAATTTTMTLTDGGSQVYIDGQRVTTKPTASYPLKPEYDTLYRQFASLIANQTSHVDAVTPRLLQEIQEKAIYTRGPRYDL